VQKIHDDGLLIPAHWTITFEAEHPSAAIGAPIMWKAFLFAFLLASGALLAAPAQAGPREDLLATPDWLQAHLADKNLVILHVGTEKGYSQGHIPGARLVKGPDDLLSVNANGLSMEVPPPEILRAKLEALGISDDSRIVVYNEGDAFQLGARVIFNLEVAGVGDRSQILDGGLKTWKKTGHATTTETAEIVPGHLAPLKMQPLVVDAGFVQNHAEAPGYDLIDAREAILYGGPLVQLDVLGLIPRWFGETDGHIPGAKSLPFASVVDAEGKLKSPGELKALFSQAGYKPGDHVIAYCHIGRKAGSIIFAARTLGMDVTLYDGSIEDWTQRHLPVDTSASPD
jgi:thiosulfate/3-mercaptopyruvate sulfurtransferase